MAKEFEDILKMYTEDCMFVIEHMPLQTLEQKVILCKGYKDMDDQIDTIL